MNSLISNMSVRNKLLAIVLAFCAVLVGMAFYTVAALEHHSVDSDVENIVVRQSMLTQKFAKEVIDELAQDKATAISIKTNKTKTLFDLSHKALLEGGETFVDLAMTKTLSIPKHADPEIDVALKKVGVLWKDLQAAALVAANEAPGSGLYNKSIAAIRNLSMEVLAAMDGVAVMYDLASARNINAMVKVELVVLAIVLLLGILVSFYVGSGITHPLDVIVKATRKITAGDLTVEEDLRRLDAKDEFSVLANSYGSMLSVTKKLQSEIVNLSENIRHGNLDVRCDGAGLEGVWAELITAINKIIDGYVIPFKGAAIYLDRISRGDIPPLITNEYPGDFNKFKESFNRNISTVTDLLAEYNSLIDAVHSGDLTARGDVSKFEGCWQEFIAGLNKIFETVVDPVHNAGEILRALSEGDLRHGMEGGYQGEYALLQNNVNTTIKRLESTVTPVQEAARFISKSATQIFAGNNSLSDRTEKQSSKLQETASSMERLIGAVRNNAENSKHANNLATNAKQSAEHGGDVVNRAVQAMDEINKSSNKIAEIIGVIDDIAFQTNLLALNASVEAARAGEQGRGFAVVATEVRNLAGRSATAAKEIKELIKDSMQKVQAGTSLVNESGETLDEIMDGVKQVGKIISEIDAASAEQIEGIEMVNKAITSIDEMVEQNAMLAERTSVASGAMKDKARELEDLMQFFKVNAPIVRDDDPDAVIDGASSGEGVSEESGEEERSDAATTVSHVTVTHNYVDDSDEWEEF